MDNLFLGRFKNIEGYPKFFIENVTKINKLDIGKIDIIFHFGNKSSAPMFKEDLIAWEETIKGFIEVCKFARKNNARLVFASSSSISGPLTLYTSSRLIMERIAHTLNLNYAALRYYSVYGPNEKHKGQYANCLTQFLWDMKKGKSPIIYGDGTQTRDFIHVKDIVRANVFAMNAKSCGIFNIGTGREISFNKIVDLLNNALGTDIKPIYIPNPIKKYVEHTHCDIRHAKSILDFEAKIDLEEGIKKQVETYD